MMRLFALAAMVFAAIYGWNVLYDDVSRAANSRVNFGTLDGVDNCVLKIDTDLVKLTAKRGFCANKFQTPIYNLTVTGFAGPDFATKEKVFTGTIGSEDTDWVVTQVNFRIEVGENQPKETVDVFARVWLEPNAETAVKLKMSSLTDDAWEKWQKCTLGSADAACFSWIITTVSGVRLK